MSRRLSRWWRVPLGVFFPGEEYTEIWGVFPYRNYVLASDMNNGLWIFKVMGK